MGHAEEPRAAEGHEKARVQKTIRAMGELIADLQTELAEVLQTKRQHAKLVLEVWCHDGLITESPTIMVKRDTSK